MKKKAFTLVEVLLVIVIIAILTAIVLVAINPARQIAQARNAERSSSVKTIVEAISQYSIDNNGVFPAGIDGALKMIGSDGAGCDVACGGVGGGLSIDINDDTSGEISAGTFSDTQWDGANSWIELTPAGQIATTGSYASTITDATASSSWENISWEPEHPYHKELPDNGVSEVAYNSGNANMSNNTLLLHLNESSGVISDSSGQNNNGSDSGGITYGSSATLNTGITLDGINDYINLTTSIEPELGQTASMSFWLKTTQIGNNTMWQAPGMAGVEEAGGGNDIFWGWVDASGRIGVMAGNDDGAKSTNPINDNVWHHIILTRDQITGVVEVYVDGSLDQSTTSEVGAKTTTFSSIGRIEDTGGTPAYLSGSLDEVAIYSRVLTPGEVTDLYFRGALDLKFKVRSCDDALCAGENYIGPDGTAGTNYSEIDNSGLGLPSFTLTNVPDNQYFQYQATFTTNNSSYTPELISIQNSGTTLAVGGATTAAACLDLDIDLAEYVADIPLDPQTDSLGKTYYAIQEVTAGRIDVYSCSAELGKGISASR